MAVRMIRVVNALANHGLRRNYSAGVVKLAQRPILASRNGSLAPSFRCFASDQSTFEAAVSASTQLPEEPSNETKLELYALFKQASVGPAATNNTKKPSAFDIAGKYKLNAWTQLGDLSQEDARSKYIALVTKLGGKLDAAASTASSTPQESVLLDKRSSGLLTVRLNRPKVFNAVNTDMYKIITKTLNVAANDDSTKIVVLTGTGKYYSAGNDLSAFAKLDISDPAGLKAFAKEGEATLVDFVDSIINFPKPLVAAVNGPAIGLMVTTLALCDVVLAAESATFATPFSATAQSPEGASSATFFTAMGPSTANQMLFFNRKLSAQEALQVGFVGQIFPGSGDEFLAAVQSYLEKDVLESSSAQSMVVAKSLVRPEAEKERLRAVNRLESALLLKQWFRPEFPKFIANFAMRKKPSK